MLILDVFPFPVLFYSIWINPKIAEEWPYTRNINMIREIFPMFELAIDGLEAAVGHLMSDN